MTAIKARENYQLAIDRCKQQWERISALTAIQSPSRTEREELLSAEHCFTLVISADYQQSQRSEQPGTTYYLQKNSHDMFGIVDHRNEKSMVYIFDELLTHYYHSVREKHSWIKRVAIFLDNATSTNYFLMGHGDGRQRRTGTSLH